MKPGQANKKGGEFERWVCRMLTKWITGQEKPELFWRSATSGAKATMDARKGHKSKMGGDLVSIDAQGQWFMDCFSLECKDRHDYGNLDLLFIDKGDFLKWWNQCQGDAGRVNKVPMMIVKRYRRDPIVVLPQWMEMTAPISPAMVFRGSGKLQGLVIYPFLPWLEQTKVITIEKLAEERHERLANSYLASRQPISKHLGKAGGK